MHPVLFTIKKINLFGFSIGPLHVYSYGTMLVLGFLAGMFLASKRAKNKNINKDDVIDLAFFILVFGILGGRISYVLIHLGYYSKHFSEIFNLSMGGLAWHGGLIFAIATMLVFCKIKKINIRDLFDCIAPSFPLGQAIGRIGCFLNGCCGGKLLTGISLKALGKAKIFHMRHPTQIYELILDLMIFFFLLFYEKKYSKFKGELFLVYLASYSFIRFMLEYLRDYPEEIVRHALGILSMGQIVSLVIFILSVIWITICRKTSKRI
ncbi:MAG: prolipoprotein diacylglyceryl transferase [Armatimonadota bacterium]